MLTIDRLSLRLPPGFGARAAGIVRLTAGELARSVPRGESGPLPSPAELRAALIIVPRGLDDREIATRLGAAIRAALTAAATHSKEGERRW